MLFSWGVKASQWILIIILVTSSLLAIAINNADITGRKKLQLFQLINRFSKLFLLPGALWVLVSQIVTLSRQEYISMEHSTANFIYAFCTAAILIVCFWKLLPLTAEGISECRRKSITASKYERIFKRLRGAFVAIMFIIIFFFSLVFLFVR
ncbi:MAG TPA: hypothetical protein VLC98_02610 [Phnomibacter sp.]|nr:hypothetical protein [Phnomibacter sp.]